MRRSMYVREIKVKFGPKKGKTAEVSSPEEVARFLQATFGHEQKEFFGVVCLNARNEVIGYNIISMGVLMGTLVEPREVFQVVILSGAASFIIFHNHPSGNLQPSNEDVNITRNIKECAKIFRIPLLDHIIVSDLGHTSFSTLGLI